MTIIVNPATVTSDGVVYEARSGAIRSTKLGYEDHGILTFAIVIEGGSWGVTAGGYGLDNYSEVPTVHTGALIGAVLGVMKVDSWERLIGLRCHALFEGGRCQGIANADLSDVLIFPRLFGGQT